MNAVSIDAVSEGPVEREIPEHILLIILVLSFSRARTDLSGELIRNISDPSS